MLRVIEKLNVLAAERGQTLDNLKATQNTEFSKDELKLIEEIYLSNPQYILR